MRKVFVALFTLVMLISIGISAVLAYEGNVLTLDGSGEYAWAPHSSSLNISGNSLTMEAWVQLVGPTGNHWIICKQNIDSNRSYGFYINSEGQGDERKVVPSIHADWKYEGAVGTGVLDYNTWYHVAIVYNGSKIKTYINGILNGEADLTGNLQQNLKELTIGGTYWSHNDTTNGSIDEVRIWNIARTQADIQDTMSQSLTGNEDGLVGYWQFEIMEDLGVNNDGADDFCDLSMYGNHLDMFRYTRISGTITDLAEGQHVDIYANNENGTPYDGSDDFGFGTGINGSGSGTDTYYIDVSPAAGYRVEFNPEDAVRVYYKDGIPAGTWIWDDASFVDATIDVSGIGVAITTGNTISGTISGLSESQSFWIYAQNANGTPDDESDDFDFQRYVTNTTGASVEYTIHVAPLEGYRFSIIPDDGVRVFYKEGEATGTFRWDNATLVDATSNINEINITVSPVSTVSGTITGLSAGQSINIHASNDNGTPDDGSDDFGFGFGMNGSGSLSDSYTLHVPSMAGYRIEFSPDDALRVFYKSGTPEGTWNWDEATLVNATSDVTGIDVTITTGNTISGTITGLSEGQFFWVYGQNANGTPNDESDDFDFQRYVQNEGTTSVEYTIHVPPLAGYRVSVIPDDGVRVFYKEGEATGTFSWTNATLVDATSNVSNINITVGPVSTISGTITNLESGQYINIHASNDNGTPDDGSDDFGFGLGINGSGTGTDTYTISVAQLSGYRVEFSPDDAFRVYYKFGEPTGTWNWDDATFVDASSDVSGIDVEIRRDTDGDGITDYDEDNVYHTNPNSADTDGDGINDGDELDYWGNDYWKDPDGDGDSNLLDGDSDNDGYLDGEEIFKGSDPADSGSTPQTNLYDDFSGTYIDGEKWKYREFVREVDSGVLVSKLGNSGDGYARNGTGFQNPQTITDIECDITVVATNLDTGNNPISFARIGGFFYNTQSSGDSTGDIWAEIQIGDRGSGLEAFWEVEEALEDGNDWFTVGSGTLIEPGILIKETAYSVKLDYNGSNGIEFTVAGENYPYTGPTRERNAVAQHKQLGTGIDADGGSGTGYVHASFDNVYVTIDNEHSEYDTFDTAPLDPALWGSREIVREITGDHKMLMAAHTEGQSKQSTLYFSELQPYVEAKVVVKSESQVFNGAKGRVRIAGYFFNDMYGHGEYNGYEGNVFAQVYIDLYDDGSLKAQCNVSKSMTFDESDWSNLFWDEFSIPIQTGREYTLGIHYTGSHFVFKCKDNVTLEEQYKAYEITATNQYPAYNQFTALMTKAYGNGSGDGYMKSQFDDVYVITEPVSSCPGDFDTDGDVDGSDLAVFAADFGRTDCSGDCEGDLDDDGDVDGSDLAIFAADFGRTDCME